MADRFIFVLYKAAIYCTPRLYLCELRICKHQNKVQQFKYMEDVLTEDGKCNTEIPRFIGMAKDVF